MDAPIRLDETIPFVRATLEGPPTEAAAILRAAERRHGLRLEAATETKDGIQSDEWYERHLWPFLSDTHLVLTAGDLFATGCALLNAEGLDVTPTWRHWGAIVAEWANRHWFSRPEGLGQTEWSRRRRPWEYLDFYTHGYLEDLVEGYTGWRDAVTRVLAISGRSGA